MPITITPSPQGNIVGPFVNVGWSSDFIGPLPEGSLISLTISTDAEGSNVVGFVSKPTNLNHGTINLYQSPRESTTTESGTYGYTEGGSVYVLAQLSEPGSVLDSGSTTATWSNTVGLAGELRIIQQDVQSASTGLTTTQATQLSNIDTRTQNVLGDTTPTITDTAGAHPYTLAELFSGKALDTLTLTELSPGPTSDPVTSDISGWYFGVIVRIATIPDHLQPLTPASDWYPPDLAVLRVFRGTDMEERFGIHTPSLFHPFHGLYGGVVLNETLLFGVPPLTSIEVDWAPGVSGQVFLMLFP